MELLTIIALIATVAGFVYLLIIGQKSIPEWLRERNTENKVAGEKTEIRSVASAPAMRIAESEKRSSHDSSGQMLVVTKGNSSPGLDLESRKVPSIDSSDILVRVSATSICGTDLGIYEWNQWARSRVRPPVVLGHEFCGIVVECGKDVTQVQSGDLVAAESHISCGKCSYCQNGNSNVCLQAQVIGVDRDGAFAEYVCIPAKNAWKLPPDFPVETAAIMEPFGNAVHAALSQDIANRNLLITGCGPQGLMSIAIAKWAGARVVCVIEVSSYRLNLARQMGADLLINAKSNDEDIDRAIMEVTHGQGIDVFLEMSGSTEALPQGLRILRSAGKAVLMGIYSKSVQIDFDHLVTFKGTTISGVYGRRSDETWERMRTVLASGSINLNPLITHRLPLDQVDKAFSLMRSREAGKVILFPGNTTAPTHPIHFVPTCSAQASQDLSWHDAYKQQVKEIATDSRSRELALMKDELDNLFGSAQEIQQTIYGYSRSLLASDIDPRKKPKIKREVDELTKEQERIRARIREIENQIESSQDGSQGGANSRRI